MLKKFITVFFCFLLLRLPLLFSCIRRSLPPSSDTHEGIDVSMYQGDIDFEQVADSGIEGVYIRSSLGSSYIDPYFEQNYSNAKAWRFVRWFLSLCHCPHSLSGCLPGSFFCKYYTGQGL